jgi:hypothetical protein
MRKYNPDARHWSRCGHGWCEACKTRRGRNRGNRNARHAVKAFLGRVRGTRDDLDS